MKEDYHEIFARKRKRAITSIILYISLIIIMLSLIFINYEDNNQLPIESWGAILFFICLLIYLILVRIAYLKGISFSLFRLFNKKNKS